MLEKNYALNLIIKGIDGAVKKAELPMVYDFDLMEQINHYVSR